jgi:hypothetical protein
MVSLGQAPVAESSVRSRLFGLDAGMSDAEELRKNATICGDLAKRCKSEVEREQWLRMEQSWLALAANRDKLSLAPKRNGAALDSSSRDFGEQGPPSETDHWSMNRFSEKIMLKKKS